MLSVNENFQLNLSASCTKEQAVFRLLGWGGETIYLREPELPMTDEGIGLEDTKKIFQPDMTLESFLKEAYQNVLTSYSSKVNEDTTDEEIEELLDEKWDAIEQVESLIEEARSLLMDIVDELALGEKSELRLDLEMSSKMGVQYITLRSLDAWAQRYRRPSSQQDEKTLEIAGDIDEGDDGESSRPKKKESKADRSLYITLWYLAELYAKMRKPLLWNDGKGVNVNALAKSLEESIHAKITDGGDYEGQSFSSIQERLARGKQLVRERELHLMTLGRISRK